MTNKIWIPPQTVIGNPPAASKSGEIKKERGAFQQVLQQKLQGELKFSQHALQRLQSRDIQLEPSDLKKIESAVGKAREKGARDSLILMDNLALVVSIKNNTVITAVDGTNLRENVFTNIDSAVIV